jgi:hypothetical protein
VNAPETKVDDVFSTQPVAGAIGKVRRKLDGRREGLFGARRLVAREPRLAIDIMGLRQCGARWQASLRRATQALRYPAPAAK